MSLLHILIVTIVGGLFKIMEELEINQIIIGKQFENNDNLKKFTQIVNFKLINVNIVEEGTVINIENNICINVLWPSDKNIIDKNNINNNALVFKLKFKNFSILFTGDIEKEAEDMLISKYKIDNDLSSTILKVAHHGSKTSSKNEFLNLVRPKIALIGVGKNNKFGHPNDSVLNELKKIKCLIYRTDKDGEIEIKVDNKGRIKIT